jgi:hypothetical protein
MRRTNALRPGFRWMVWVCPLQSRVSTTHERLPEAIHTVEYMRQRIIRLFPGAELLERMQDEPLSGDPKTVSEVSFMGG